MEHHLSQPDTANPSRRADRVRTLLRAEVETACGSVGCVVRNLSETGARLELSDSGVLPPEFNLVIPNKDLSHRARVVWRSEGLVGVKFVHKGAPADPAALIEHLEYENKRLREQIRQLKARICSYEDKSSAI